MTNITPPVSIICPCCGEKLQVILIESEGKTSFGLFHNTAEADYTELSEMGYEFGIPKEEGGEGD